jgi:predicted nucleotidyltransferase
VRTEPYGVLPIFRSKLQAELLAVLFLDPADRLTSSDLRSRTGGSEPTVRRHLHHLEQAGLIESDRVGRTKRYRAATYSPLFEPLRELLERSIGRIATPTGGLRIHIDRPKVEDFCRRWKITELAFFGSVLRDDFRPDSDVDVLVVWAEDARWGLFDHIHAEEELAGILGRPVDLVDRGAIEESENPIRRRHILERAETFYVA